MLINDLQARSRPEPAKVLFLCGSNAAWSIMAEGLLRRAGRNRFLAFSAGLDPAPAVDAMTLEQLVHAGMATDHCFTKSFRRFREDSLLPLDFIFSAMDLNEIGLAGDWPGDPLLVHWKIPDPMAFTGRVSGRRNRFRQVFSSLARRVDLITALPLAKTLELRFKQQAG
jgi:arsenate reductase